MVSVQVVKKCTTIWLFSCLVRRGNPSGVRRQSAKALRRCADINTGTGTGTDTHRHVRQSLTSTTIFLQGPLSHSHTHTHFKYTHTHICNNLFHTHAHESFGEGHTHTQETEKNTPHALQSDNHTKTHKKSHTTTFWRGAIVFTP